MAVIFRNQLRDELDRIFAKGQARREAAADEQIRALRPTDIDWLEPDERARAHEIQLALVKLGPTREEIRARVAARRAARKAARESAE